MLLPIHTSGLFNHPAEPPGAEAPPRPADCAAAVLLFAVALLAALVLLGTDWHGLLTESERPLPEATRMMVIAPQPR